jgi:hypothetical protein
MRFVLRNRSNRLCVIDTMKATFLPLGVLLFFAAPGFSQQVYWDGDWRYTLNDSGEATITLYVGADDEVVVPSSIGGFPVRAVATRYPSSVFSPPVTSVIIPDGEHTHLPRYPSRCSARLLERRK